MVSISYEFKVFSMRLAREFWRFLKTSYHSDVQVDEDQFQYISRYASLSVRL